VAQLEASESTNTPLNVGDAIAAGSFLLLLLGEFVADIQMFDFQTEKYVWGNGPCKATRAQGHKRRAGGVGCDATATLRGSCRRSARRYRRIAAQEPAGRCVGPAAALL